MNGTVLIIEDNKELSQLISENVRQMGLKSLCAADLAEASLFLGQNAVDLVLLDVKLPDGNGISFIPKIKVCPSNPEIIILTGFGHKEDAVAALNQGAWDYLTKPVQMSQLCDSIKNVFLYKRQYGAEAENVQNVFSKIVGCSYAISQLNAKILKAAESEANVHIFGETGTGKELIAHTIHEYSARADKAFVIVDCSTLTETLGYSTLFGHTQGAYTGASVARDGLIKLAHKGTLFLDEVGELNLEMQKIFLRVLEEKTFIPLGEKYTQYSDFRLISATNKDLASMVKAGTFREDLYYRLCGVQLEIPPLRQRKEDLPLLINERFNQLVKKGGALKRVSSETMKIFNAYDWPGNVRELFYVLEMACLMANMFPVILPQHLPKQLRVDTLLFAKTMQNNAVLDKELLEEKIKSNDTNSLLLPDEKGFFPTLKEVKERELLEIEKKYLLELMNLVGNDMAEACEISGLSKSRLYFILNKCGIRRDKWGMNE